MGEEHDGIARSWLDRKEARKAWEVINTDMRFFLVFQVTLSQGVNFFCKTRARVSMILVTDVSSILTRKGWTAGLGRMTYRSLNAFDSESIAQLGFEATSLAFLMFAQHLYVQTLLIIMLLLNL